jgi:hypothetical protein
MNRRLIVGSIVHYNIAEHPCIAAIVTQIHTDDAVALTPFYPPGSPRIAATAAKAHFVVHHAETKREMHIRSWHWPDHSEPNFIASALSRPQLSGIIEKDSDAPIRSTPPKYSDGAALQDRNAGIWIYRVNTDVWWYNPDTHELPLYEPARSWHRLLAEFGPLREIS